MCIRTENLWFLSASWYYTPSQAFKVIVRSLTTIRKLCLKSSWQSPAECQEEGESIFPKVPLFPSSSGSTVYVCMWVCVCDGTCVSAGWSTRRKTTRGACTSYLRVIIQICLAWDVHPASPSTQPRLWQWWGIKRTNKSLSCCQSVPWTSPVLRADVHSSLHLAVQPGVSGGPRDHHGDRDHQYGGRRLQQPHTVCQSEQRLVRRRISPLLYLFAVRRAGNKVIWFFYSAVGWYVSTATTGGASSSWNQ